MCFKISVLSFLINYLFLTSSLKKENTLTSTHSTKHKLRLQFLLCLLQTSLDGGIVRTQLQCSLEITYGMFVSLHSKKCSSTTIVRFDSWPVRQTLACAGHCFTILLQFDMSSCTVQKENVYEFDRVPELNKLRLQLKAMLVDVGALPKVRFLTSRWPQRVCSLSQIIRY